MDVLKVWNAARTADARAIEVDGVSVSVEVVAALCSYSAPRGEAGEMVFVRGPAPRRRLVDRDGVAVLEVVR
jgi:hypothetical protein